MTYNEPINYLSSPHYIGPRTSWKMSVATPFFVAPQFSSRYACYSYLNSSYYGCLLDLSFFLWWCLQKQFSELLMKAASDYGALSASVADFQWSQNFKEPPSVWAVCFLDFLKFFGSKWMVLSLLCCNMRLGTLSVPKQIRCFLIWIEFSFSKESFL